MSRYHVPGVAVGIWNDGKEELGGWGVTNVDHPLAVDADTLFQIASVTKTSRAPMESSSSDTRSSRIRSGGC